VGQTLFSAQLAELSTVGEKLSVCVFLPESHKLLVVLLFSCCFLLLTRDVESLFFVGLRLRLQG